MQYTWKTQTVSSRLLHTFHLSARDKNAVSFAPPHTPTYRNVVPLEFTSLRGERGLLTSSSKPISDHSTSKLQMYNKDEGEGLASVPMDPNMNAMQMSCG